MELCLSIHTLMLLRSVMLIMQVKFHVISHYKLRRCKGDRSIISSIHHLNKEQLTKCLASLYNLYEVNRSSESVHDNEAEFRSLYVLLHLDCHAQVLVNPSFAFVIQSHFFDPDLA